MRFLLLVATLVFLAGCSRGPMVDGMGHYIPRDDAIAMAKADSPIVEVTRTDQYTAPPTVHVIYGKDNEGRDLIAFVYTTVIRFEYTDKLMSAEKAIDFARVAGFPVDAIERSSLQVAHGHLGDRDRPIFWRLGTHAGFIWIDAETGDVLQRLDAR